MNEGYGVNLPIYQSPSKTSITSDSVCFQTFHKSTQTSGRKHSTQMRISPTQTVPDAETPDTTPSDENSPNPPLDCSNKESQFAAIKFLQDSSVAVITKIGNSETQIRRILWTVVLVAALTGCGFHIRGFMNLYFQYPVVISLEVQSANSLEFPSVTVCNVNKMVRSFEHCLYFNETDPMECYKFFKDQGQSPTSESPDPPKGTSLVISERRKLFSKIKSGNFTPEQKFLAAYYAASEAFRSSQAQPAHQLIDSCTFQGKRCSPSNFQTFLTLRYGNCFTFNSNGSLRTTATGQEGGLQLKLFYNFDFYMDHTPTVGGRVVIHHPSEIPDPEEVGHFMGPGMETSIQLKQTLMKRLPAPYKDHCWDYAAGILADDHSPRECRKLCIQQENFNRCGCTDPTMTMSGDLPQCDLNDEIQMECLDGVLLWLANDSTPCYCPRACLSRDYGELVSHSRYPSFQSFMKGRRRRGKWDRILYREHRKAYGTLNVFYSSLETKTYHQSPTFLVSELLSNLGGELGLWLGMSSFALFEVVENVVRLGKHIHSAVSNVW